MMCLLKLICKKLIKRVELHFSLCLTSDLLLGAFTADSYMCVYTSPSNRPKTEFRTSSCISNASTSGTASCLRIQYWRITQLFLKTKMSLKDSKAWRIQSIELTTLSLGWKRVGWKRVGQDCGEKESSRCHFFNNRPIRFY